MEEISINGYQPLVHKKNLTYGSCKPLTTSARKQNQGKASTSSPCLFAQQAHCSVAVLTRILDSMDGWSDPEGFLLVETTMAYRRWDLIYPVDRLHLKRQGWIQPVFFLIKNKEGYRLVIKNS